MLLNPKLQQSNQFTHVKVSTIYKDPGTPEGFLYSEWHKEAIEKEISHPGVHFLSQKNPNRNN